MLIRAPDSKDTWMGLALIFCASFVLVSVGYLVALMP